MLAEKEKVKLWQGDSADHGELKRAVNAVLQMMDGYRGESIIIATTNYETLLDKAVWRRFDEAVFFGMPDEKQIANLLALKLSGVRHNFETDDLEVVSMFKGFSHADIERILRRAVKEMILSGREFLEIKHLRDALSHEVKRNLSRKEPLCSDDIIAGQSENEIVDLNDRTWMAS